MEDISDVLTVSFDSGVQDESALCVTRKYGEKTTMLKMELGEQADILYHLLTEQMAKAEIKEESEDAILNGIKKTCDDCIYSFVIPGRLKECEKRWMHVDKTEHMNETCPDFKEEKNEQRD